MTLIRWNPLNGIEEFNRFFNDSLFQNEADKEDELAFSKPISDIIETKHSYKVIVEMPGIPKEDIAISVKDDVLTIKGEKKQEKKDNNSNYYRNERSYGLFQRELVLPKNANNKKISAEYKNGVLKVVIPKATEIKPQEIQITTK